MHLAHSSQDLAKLSAEVMSLPNLSRAEQHTLSKLFAQIKQRSVTTSHATDGKNVYHMNAKPARVVVAADELNNAGNKARGHEKQIAQVCIPYIASPTRLKHYG